MPQWIRFKADHDHEWPSRAITAFKKDMVVFVKDEVANGAFAQGKAEPAEKPQGDDPNHVVTPSTVESSVAPEYSGSDEVPALSADAGPADGLAQRNDADDVGTELQLPADGSTRKRPRHRKS
jgi:hypothetical protein